MPKEPNWKAIANALASEIIVTEDSAAVERAIKGMRDSAADIAPRAQDPKSGLRDLYEGWQGAADYLTKRRADYVRRSES